MSTIVSLNMMRDDKILKMDSTSPLRKRSATFEIFDSVRWIDNPQVRIACWIPHYSRPYFDQNV